LTSDTQQIIYCSRICLASIQPNLRIDPTLGPPFSDTQHAIDSVLNQQPDMDTPLPPTLESDSDHATESFRSMAVIDPDDLIGRTYITSPADDGTQT